MINVNEKCIMYDFVSEKYDIEIAKKILPNTNYSVLFIGNPSSDLLNYWKDNNIRFEKILFDPNIRIYVNKSLILRVAMAVAIAEAENVLELILAYSLNTLQCISFNPYRYINKLITVMKIGSKTEMKIKWVDTKYSLYQFSDGVNNFVSNKSILLFSGGLDCTVAAHIMKKELSKDLYLINFYYGQKNFVEEKTCVDFQRERLKITKNHYFQIFLSKFYKRLSSTSGILNPFIELDMNNAELEYVPLRNTIFISIALELCKLLKIKYISTGSQKSDNISPDNSEQYYNAYQNLIDCQFSTMGIRIDPLLFLIGGKSDIIRRGIKLNVDFSYTWTCHSGSVTNGKRTQCGKCSDCMTRYYSFKETGYEDPLPYNTLPNKGESIYDNK